MRGYLLGTTALAGMVVLSNVAWADGGPAAAPPPPPPAALETGGIRLELRGYAQFALAGIVNEPQYFGLDRRGVDRTIGVEIGVPDASDAFFGNNVAFGSDSEVHFRGKTTLDNGLTVSFRAELELEDDARVDRDSDTIDEVYAQFDGAFGRLQFGMQDGTADQMIISAPNVFAQVTISSIDLNPFEMYADPAFNGVGLPGGPFPVSRTRRILGVSSYLDTSPDFTEDFTKVIYFTPRIYGVQLGASYTPNPCRNDTGFDLDNEETFACGRADKFGRNFWEVGGNYVQDFKGFGVGLSGSYGKGDANSLEFDLSTVPSEWHVGGELFFVIGSGKFTIGGAFKETNGIDAENRGFIDADSQQFDAGAKFDFGPWEFGGSYGKADSLFAASDEELVLIIGGVNYHLGPGIRLGLGVIHGEAEQRLPDIPADTTDGTAVFSELDLRF